jgi:hypothetical protein
MDDPEGCETFGSIDKGTFVLNFKLSIFNRIIPLVFQFKEI